MKNGVSVDMPRTAALNTHSPGVSSPSNAMDGNMDGSYHSDHIDHSSGSPTDYLDITLAGPATLASLKLYGRTDCCTGPDP